MIGGRPRLRRLPEAEYELPLRSGREPLTPQLLEIAGLGDRYVLRRLLFYLQRRLQLRR